jgi:hypothetical protein
MHFRSEAIGSLTVTQWSHCFARVGGQAVLQWSRRPRRL